MLERAPYSPQLALFEFSVFQNLEVHSKKPIFNQLNKSIKKQVTLSILTESLQRILQDLEASPGAVNIALGGYCLKGVMHRYNNFINKALY
jgi:hypothetical protein